MAVGSYRARSGTEAIDAAFQLVKSNYPSLVTISAICFLPGLLAHLIDPRAEQGDVRYPVVTIGLYILMGLFGLILQGSLVRALADAYQGRPIDVGYSLRQGLQKFWPMFLAGLVIALCLMVGFILLVIPALIVFAWFFVTPAVVMLEDKSSIEAMSRSKDLCEHSKLRILGQMLVVIATFFVFGAAAGLLAALTRSLSLMPVLQIILQMLLVPLYPAFIVIQYYDARIRLEGYDVELMAQAMATPAAAQPGTA